MHMTSSATRGDIDSLIRGMSGLELRALQDRLQREEAARKAEIEDAYGADFSNIVGLENIYSLTEVQAKDLGLENDAKYPSNIVTPSMLSDHIAVRGLMGSYRPFIAIKIEVLDPRTKQRIDTVVELIFKRFSLKGDGAKGRCREDSYVTALYNISEKGKSLRSFLYSKGYMIETQKAAVRDLLDGKTIKAQVPESDHLIRMAAE